MRRCMTRNTSSSSANVRYLPRRSTDSITRPLTASSTWSGGAGAHQRGSYTVVARILPAGQAGRQLAAHGLDLGQLGHQLRRTRPVTSSDCSISGVTARSKRANDRRGAATSITYSPLPR